MGTELCRISALFLGGGGGFNEVETILTSEPADGDASLLRSRTDSQRQFHSIGRFGVSRTSAATTNAGRSSHHQTTSRVVALVASSVAVGHGFFLVSQLLGFLLAAQ